MTGYCVKGLHKDCPDTKDDTYTCTCPCHISSGIANEIVEHLNEAKDDQD